MSPGVPFHVSPGQVLADSISPDAQIVVGNYVGSDGQYTTIQNDIETFGFKKELHGSNRHAQYAINRDSICVDDVDITASSPFRVKKSNKRKVAPVKSYLFVAYRKWESDRAQQLAVGTECAAVAPFQTQTAPPAVAPAPRPAATGHDDDGADF